MIPQIIYLSMVLIGLIVVAGKNGQPRDAYNFPMSLMSAIIGLLLLYLGGFFDVMLNK